MKSFKEYVTEAKVDRQIVKSFFDNNKGNEGSEVIDINGNSLPNTVYLGGGVFIDKTDPSHITITKLSKFSDEMIEVSLNSKQANVLKKNI